MKEYMLFGALICMIIIIVFTLLKKNKELWIILFSVGLFPYITIICPAVYAIFNGSGLVGDKGGIDSGGFIIVMYLWYYWYIFIPAALLIVVSLYKIFCNNDKKLSNKRPEELEEEKK